MSLVSGAFPEPGKKPKPLDLGEKWKGDLLEVWKRRSIFWDLEYWPLLETPHCLDLMHITNNACESFPATLFNLPDKTKDVPKARRDLIWLTVEYKDKPSRTL